MIAQSTNVRSSIRMLFTMQLCSQTPQESPFSKWEEILAIISSNSLSLVGIVKVRALSTGPISISL